MLGLQEGLSDQREKIDDSSILTIHRTASCCAAPRVATLAHLGWNSNYAKSRR